VRVLLLLASVGALSACQPNRQEEDFSRISQSIYGEVPFEGVMRYEMD
jgi:hypothetical protein